MAKEHTINFGRKVDAKISPESVPTKADTAKEHFPSFHVSDKPELHKLPVGKHFTFHGKGKIVHASKSKRGDGTESHSHEIEIHHMTPDMGSLGATDNPQEEGLETELDKIAEAKASKKK